METDDQALRVRLDELETLATVPAICLAFYRLTVSLVTVAHGSDGLRIAVAGLLDIELRYHRELHALTERHDVALMDLQAASERHRLGLNAVYQYAKRLGQLETLAEAARDLVLAECSYHLHQTAEVVASLERVVRLGMDQPLVQFALGYSRYLLALETCTDPLAAAGELVVRNPASFKVQCLRAVGALEDGLQGTELDGRLYWWIGVILEAAGLTEAAQDAYDRSAQQLHPRSDVGDAGWLGRVVRPAPRAISDEEVRQAGRALDGPFDPAALLDPGQDEW